MRHILMICEKFPPFNTSGAGRPFYFAKYLPELGYEPLVVASTVLGSDDRDDSLLEQLPSEVRVWRTPRIFSPAVQRWRMRRTGRAGSDTSTDAEAKEPAAAGARGAVPYLGWWLHWELDWGAIATVAGWVGARATSPDV